MEIIIEGWRAGREDRREAESVPASELPPLSDEQKSVAKKLGISEEAYARSAFAGKKNQERLLQKTKRFGGLLQDVIQRRFNDARVDRIRLVTIDHEYRVDIFAAGRPLVFRVMEEIVDDFVEGGSEASRRQIEQSLEVLLTGRAA